MHFFLYISIYIYIYIFFFVKDNCQHKYYSYKELIWLSICSFGFLWSITITISVIESLCRCWWGMGSHILFVCVAWCFQKSLYWVLTLFWFFSVFIVCCPDLSRWIFCWFWFVYITFSGRSFFGGSFCWLVFICNFHINIYMWLFICSSTFGIILFCFIILPIICSCMMLFWFTIFFIEIFRTIHHFMPTFMTLSTHPIIRTVIYKVSWS